MQNLSIIRIIVANGSKLFKEGLILLLSAYPNLLVIDEAEDGSELIGKCKRNPSDLVLIDSQLKDPDAFCAVKVIKEDNCRIKIVVMVESEYNDNSIVGKRKYINGLISKDICRSELELAIQKVMMGEYYLDRRLKRNTRQIKESVKAQPAFSEPTDRENEILYLLSKGLSSQQISEKLFISIKTVSSHRSKLIKKYNLHSSTQLLHFAHKHYKESGNGKE